MSLRLANVTLPELALLMERLDATGEIEGRPEVTYCVFYGDKVRRRYVSSGDLTLLTMHAIDLLIDIFRNTGHDDADIPDEAADMIRFFLEHDQPTG